MCVCVCNIYVYNNKQVLRNIALEPVETEFVFLLDIDLVPDVGFYPYVMSQVDFTLLSPELYLVLRHALVEAYSQLRHMRL